MGRYGGKNTQLFFAKVKTTLNGYDLKQLDKTTAATSATNRVLMLDESVSVKRNITNKVANVEFDQDKDDAAYKLYHDATTGDTASEASSVQPAKRQYEQGTSAFGDAATTSGQLVVAISYSAKDANNKRKVWAILGTASDDSGSDEQAADKPTSPTTKVNGVKAEYDLDVSALLDSTLVAGSQTLTIPAGRGYVWAFLTAA